MAQIPTVLGARPSMQGVKPTELQVIALTGDSTEMMVMVVKATDMPPLSSVSVKRRVAARFWCTPAFFKHHAVIELKYVKHMIEPI